MNQNELILFYKDLYFSEIARKEKITDRAQVLFGFVATGLTLLTYMMKAVDINALTTASTSLLAFCTFSFTAITYSAFLLKNVFWGNTYKYVSSPSDMEEHRAEVEHYQNQLKKQSVSPEPGSSFEDFLVNNLVDAASHNVKANEERIEKMNRFYKSSIYSIVLFVLAGCVFVMTNLDNAEKPKAIESSRQIAPEKEESTIKTKVKGTEGSINES